MELYPLRPCCEIKLKPCLGKSFIQHSGPLNDAGIDLGFQRFQVGQRELFAVSNSGMLFMERRKLQQRASDRNVFGRSGKKG